jgi:hypothetical protein
MHSMLRSRLSAQRHDVHSVTWYALDSGATAPRPLFVRVLNATVIAMNYNGAFDW